MVIVALLLTLAVPRYFHSVARAREAVLKQDLAAMRDAIDKYFADTGRYPPTLNDLVQRKYLRKIPRDPITDSPETWVVLPPADAALGGVYDVRSGAEGAASDGLAYQDW
jgi:general secretion pathway protein G